MRNLPWWYKTMCQAEGGLAEAVMKGAEKRIKEGIIFYCTEEGPVLGSKSGQMKEADGLLFKNLSGEKELLPYEDWRLDDEIRAADLAKRLSVEEIAGLMLYSPHQLVPFRPMGPFQGHYNGEIYREGTVEKWALTDEQKEFISKRHIRHFLQLGVEDAVTSARWSNELQARAERERWGIPVNISSDPRHGASDAAAEYKSEGADVSKWPEGLGMAAIADRDCCREYAGIASREYRALGITTALGPQIDLATDPRWMRYEDTFGGSRELATELGRTLIDGMQTTEGEEDGWGKDSVIAMAKHWPGGGTCEGGRDAHYPFGKYAVYPGGRFKEHQKVFTEGAFRLEGSTGKAASVMPYYSVLWDQDPVNHENVGNSYSRYMIHDLLREKYGYDGVVCTDWGITADPLPEVDSFSSRCYGVENLSVAERHLRIIMNGVDQFGGNDDSAPVLEAYRIGCARYGEKVMRERMELSAKRLLLNMFRLGLFENPYLDPEESAKIVGNPDYVKKGKEAQRASLCLLKNRSQVLPLKKGIRIFVPDRTIAAKKGFFRQPEPEQRIIPVPETLAQKYYIPVDHPEDADAAIVFIESPISCGYSEEDRKNGGSGYLPVTLQYRPYTAAAAREHSIAGGDFREEQSDRGYRNKSNVPYNAGDLDLILNARKTMGDRPVIVVLRLHNPAVVREFEPVVDGILVDFGVQKDAVLDVLFGDYDPRGRLPLILPENMETVEKHKEDVFDDIKPYVDSEGHTYGFGFGMNYKSVRK